MDTARIPKFYRHSIQKRLEILRDRSIITEEDYISLVNDLHLLKPNQADRMIENVITVFGLPLGIGLNFMINGKPYIIPMVVEEPSIVAAVSSAAKTVLQAGGFQCTSTDPILIGQVQIVNVTHPEQTQEKILASKEEILNLANSLHPNMVARGGGANDLEVRILSSGSGDEKMVVVHLLVDTRDAMGANLVNSMCEGVAPLIEKITEGTVNLRILSNLTDRSLVTSRCRIPTEHLDFNDTAGEEVRDGIVSANNFALADPYRAATHNKGIMNGIDPVAIATGNDWRAIEAAAHAFAARDSRYRALTRWEKAENGDLTGEIKLPLKVGIVGGSLKANPAVGFAHRLLDIQSAQELAEVMAAVGLAQNFAALRALSTEGIQRGHMTLHARSVAHAAGTPAEKFEAVVERLIESGDIKVWKAEEILQEMEQSVSRRETHQLTEAERKRLPAGHGKIILFGEHSVVYGSHAIAAPLPLAMQAKVWEDSHKGIRLLIPRWGVEETIREGSTHRHSVYKSLELLLQKLELSTRNLTIEIFPQIPRAMGLGGSAALAVAIIRALDAEFNIGLSDEDVQTLSYESEKIAHGNPSGIDNTLATYGRFILFRRGDPPFMQNFDIDTPLQIVVGLTGVESLTAKMVSRVKQGWENHRSHYEKIFEQIDDLTLSAVHAIEENDLHHLGKLMNINQGLLNALEVSSREIEEMISIARKNGALGAKLTGGGGGGAIIALCPHNAEQVVSVLHQSGYEAFVTEIGNNK